MCSEENNVDVLGPEASEEEKIQKRFNICLQIQGSGKMKKKKKICLVCITVRWRTKYQCQLFWGKILTSTYNHFLNNGSIQKWKG